MELRNESGLEFTDISSERYRTYKYPDGETITIKEPTHLHVSKSGGHRILNKAERSHYIQPGWRHLWWEVFDNKPHFVK